MPGRLERAFGRQDGPVGPVLLGLAGVWGLVTLVLMLGILDAVDGTKKGAEQVTKNLTAIEKTTQKTSLATELTGTARQILVAVEPVEPRLAQVNSSAKQLDRVTGELLADVQILAADSGTTLANVQAASRLAASIVASSDEIARLAAQTRRAVQATVPRADTAYSNIYFTQALSRSIRRQVDKTVADIAEIVLHTRRNEARGGPGP